MSSNERLLITLPDGTKVHIGNCSELTTTSEPSENLPKLYLNPEKGTKLEMTRVFYVISEMNIILDENGRKIGTFCTDSALFCVCDLAQVLAYHPDFLNKNEKYPGTFCIVRDFDGEVSLLNDENGNLQFIGTGKNGFRTVCSGGKYEN